MAKFNFHTYFKGKDCPSYKHNETVDEFFAEYSYHFRWCFDATYPVTKTEGFIKNSTVEPLVKMALDNLNFLHQFSQASNNTKKM